MKSAKRIISLIAVLSLLVTSICALSVGTASAATTTVKMHSTEVVYSGRGVTQRTVYIQVANAASNAKVYVHYQYYAGQEWSDVQATKLSGNIWQATFWSIETKYAIKYVGGGKTIWDNNSTRDYTREILGNSTNVKAERACYPYADKTFNIGACVRNIAYQKTVKVKYTMNNWKTTYTKALKYEMGYDFTNNTQERWSCTVSGITNSSNFKYYLVYTVNGKTYTDNNFGRYYDYGYYLHK